MRVPVRLVRRLRKRIRTARIVPDNIRYHIPLIILEPPRRDDNSCDDDQEQDPDLNQREDIVQEDTTPSRYGVSEAGGGRDGYGDAPDRGTVNF